MYLRLNRLMPLINGCIKMKRNKQPTITLLSISLYQTTKVLFKYEKYTLFNILWYFGDEDAYSCVYLNPVHIHCTKVLMHKVKKIHSQSLFAIEISTKFANTSFRKMQITTIAKLCWINWIKTVPYSQFAMQRLESKFKQW